MSLNHRVNARNEGLRRTSRLTVWTLGGGLVISGGFAGLSAHEFALQQEAKAHVQSDGLSARALTDSPSAADPTPSVVADGPAPAPLQAPSAAPRTTAPRRVPASTTSKAPAPRVAPRTVPQQPVISGGT